MNGAMGLYGCLTEVRELLSRDPCGHAKTAMDMIDATLASAPDTSRAPAGYAVLEHDGAIVRLERQRWIAEEIAARLPGRRVVDIWMQENES